MLDAKKLTPNIPHMTEEEGKKAVQNIKYRYIKYVCSQTKHKHVSKKSDR